MNNRNAKYNNLIESEAIEHVLLQQLMYGISVLQDEIHKFANKAMEHITGYSREELIGMHYLDILAPEFRVSARTKYEKGMDNTIVPFYGEGKFLCKDGSIKDVEVYNNLIEFEGRPAILSIIQDISTRKKVEEALRESERRFMAFMNHFPGIAFMRDAKGEYLYTNSEFELLKLEDGDRSSSRRTQEQQLKHEFDRLTYRDNSVLTRGKTIKTIERLHQKDGVHYWLMYRFPITNGTERADAIGGIGMDITERRYIEIELKKSRKRLLSLVANLHKVREDLSAQVSQEIHDELGQMLTAMKFDLSWINERIPTDSHILRGMVTKVSGDVDQAIKSVGRITSELRPRLLDELGLTSAVKWYIDEFQKRTGIQCRISIEPDEIVLDQTISTVIFRILQEALTNIARHSKAANVKIKLKQSNSSLILKIVDDGVGITDEQINRSDAFGLMGMKERASSIGGVVRIIGAINKGTKIHVTVPTK